MSITTVTAIIKDCCEAEPADPDHPETICINVIDLEIIVARNLEAMELELAKANDIIRRCKNVMECNDPMNYRLIFGDA